MTDFYWDKKTLRYKWKDTKRFVSKSVVEYQLYRQNEIIKDNIVDISQELIDGDITINQWTEQVAQGLKLMHSTNFLLGKGGVNSMTPTDYGILGAKLKSEYKFLNIFAQSIVEGISPEMFWYRLDLFLKGSNSSYALARDEAAKAAGYRWEKRIRTKQESCSECITYEGFGWVTIGTLPAPTIGCSCHNNCGCYKEYAIDKPQESLLHWNQNLTHQYELNCHRIFL